MISVVIPTLNAARELAPALSALVPATVDGIVREVIIADGGSRDDTLEIAEASGAEIVPAPAGRGTQLRAGAARARFPWLLFLHADTVLEPGWHAAAAEHIAAIVRSHDTDRAAAFRFQLADRGALPRVLEAAVAFRSGLLRLPYGDQGLLVSRQLYDQVGGYRDIPVMEDVDIVRRLGRRRLAVLPVSALTSARRYRQHGYIRRVLRNQTCLALYYAGVSPARIRRIYEIESERVEPLAAREMRGEA